MKKITLIYILLSTCLIAFSQKKSELSFLSGFANVKNNKYTPSNISAFAFSGKYKYYFSKKSSLDTQLKLANGYKVETNPMGFSSCFINSVSFQATYDFIKKQKVEIAAGVGFVESFVYYLYPVRNAPNSTPEVIHFGAGNFTFGGTASTNFKYILNNNTFLGLTFEYENYFRAPRKTQIFTYSLQFGVKF